MSVIPRTCQTGWHVVTSCFDCGVRQKRNHRPWKTLPEQTYTLEKRPHFHFLEEKDLMWHWCWCFCSSTSRCVWWTQRVTTWDCSKQCSNLLWHFMFSRNHAQSRRVAPTSMCQAHDVTGLEGSKSLCLLCENSDGHEQTFVLHAAKISLLGPYNLWDEAFASVVPSVYTESMPLQLWTIWGFYRTCGENKSSCLP